MTLAPRHALGLGLAAASVLAAVPAWAGSKDAAALKLDEQAMGNDYLVTKFDDAKKKLEDALAACGESDCAPNVVARLHRDLGVVLVGGLKDAAAGRNELEKAMKADASIKLDPAFAGPDVKKAWAQAKSGGGGDGLSHTPVAEQVVETPIPIWVEAPADLGAARVVVKWQAGSSAAWRSVSLHAKGGGFGGEIPCAATAKTGEVRYYVQATDETGDPVANAGSKDEPFVVAIKTDLTGDAPHLPDEPPPAHCTDDAAPATAAPDAAATTGAHPTFASVTLGGDFAWVAGSDVCALESQRSNGYTCLRQGSNGLEQYFGTPALGQSDSIPGGLRIHTGRIMVGLDRAITSNITVGARVGYAFGGGPQGQNDARGFLPLHLEARAAYFLGAAPFSKLGLRPYAFAAAGLAQVDSRATVHVVESGGPTPQPDNPAEQDLIVYKKMGQAFGGVGAGAFYATAPTSGFLVELKAMVMFPSSGQVLEPTIGYAHAL